MKKMTLCGGLLFLLACGNTPKENPTTTNKNAIESPLVGGDTDEHGCLPSAGQTWSELRQTCLQIFEAGVRLNPVDAKENEAVISAFVLFNEDKSKVEVFTPNNGQAILEKSAQGDSYENTTFKYNDKEGILYIQGEKRFVRE